MMFALATLAAYLQTCAASVAPDTMRAIISVESRGYIYAINDNTARAAYCVPGSAAYPCSRREAAAIAGRTIALGHSVDVGIAQVNSSNFRAYHVAATDMLEPCENLKAGSAILAAAYRTARARFPDQREALWHAIMAYNTGSLYAGERYVRSVVEVALTRPSDPLVPSIKILQSRLDSPVDDVRLSTTQRPHHAPLNVKIAVSPRSAPLTVRFGLTTRQADLRDTLEPAIVHH
jgi:type IV secretion system protein VirB1